MPIFLDTRGKTSLGIGVCDRCHRKFPIGDLQPDRNSPGLLVCQADNDVFDPWRLPTRQSEDITLPYYRPDVPIGVNPEAETPDGDLRTTEGDDYRLTDEDEYRITEVFP